MLPDDVQVVIQLLDQPIVEPTVWALALGTAEHPYEHREQLFRQFHLSRIARLIEGLLHIVGEPATL
jgi:hypothetical protein